MFSVSVSDLDSFRRYRDREEMTLADLMKKLRREEPLTDKMIAGRAFHRVLETAHEPLDVVTADGHVFVFVLDDEINLVPIREMRGHRDYNVMVLGAPVAVRVKARVDSIAGSTISDHKLTKQFNAERYHDAYQWRLYLSIFSGTTFIYNVFTGATTKQIIDGAAEWEITDYHRLTLYRYPEMERDIQRELAHYLEFAASQNLPQIAA